MHQHSPSDHRHPVSSSASGLITRHLILLVIAFAVLAGLTLLRQDAAAATLTAGTIALILAHIVVILVILFLARGLLTAFFQQMHGGGTAHGTLGTVGHSHAGSDQNLDTEGITISQARIYDVLVQLIFMGSQRAYLNSLLKLANIRSGEKVLDVGCGTGTLAIAARRSAPADAQIHGQDASPEMIARARQKAAEAGASVDFQPGLVEAIKASDGTFDLVMNSFMVHHLPGDLKARAFAEIYRVLKPGGRLLLVDFEPPTNPLVKTMMSLFLGQGMMQIDNSTLPPLLRAAGFTGLSIQRTGSRRATCITAVKPV